MITRNTEFFCICSFREIAARQFTCLCLAELTRFRLLYIILEISIWKTQFYSSLQKLCVVNWIKINSLRKTSWKCLKDRLRFALKKELEIVFFNILPSLTQKNYDKLRAVFWKNMVDLWSVSYLLLCCSKNHSRKRYICTFLIDKNNYCYDLSDA